MTDCKVDLSTQVNVQIEKEITLLVDHIFCPIKDQDYLYCSKSTHLCHLLWKHIEGLPHRVLYS